VIAPCTASHRRRTPPIVLLLLLLLVRGTSAFAQAPVIYHLSFTAPEHHWMEVEVRFEDVPSGPLHVMMSRSSPGRYAIHDFARNVYNVQIDDGLGAALPVEQANPSEWDVSGHRGTVRVRYRVFGDTTDGTFVGIDSSHAHLNIPAALMWARGLEERAVRVIFEPPPGSGWKVATQLHPTNDPYIFTAANLSYLIDSPAEVSNFVIRAFQVGQERFEFALHHDGTDADADRMVQDVQRIVREEAAVFGELPPYEGGKYTFLADYLPAAQWDGMEHRNSTVMTSSGALRVPEDRLSLLGTVSHEFFHSWNVERIRPRALEPFNLEDANMSGELWLAEGFTNYYGNLVLQRVGLVGLTDMASDWGRALDAVIRSPARKYRSVVQMSRMAPFVDSTASANRTDLDNTFISYYTWGEVIALGLDLTLRERTGGAVSLDDFMRAMWTRYGKPGGAEEGVVGHPYTLDDARQCLAEISGDRAFADDFFRRYIEGREVVDYETVLGKAGLLLRKASPRRAWVGPLPLTFSRRTARVSAPTMEDTPAYAAGLDQDDEILFFDGEAIASATRMDEILQRHRPGDRVKVQIRRRGVLIDLVVTTQEDPRLELVPAEVNRPLTTSERTLRDAWLRSRQ
jgi:predicted metalloprotease with PDZ domain